LGLAGVVDLSTSRYQEQEAILASGMLPVGISVGRPKFPLKYAPVYMSALAPYRLLGIDDAEEFTRRYIERLEDVGAERLGERFAALAAEHDKPGLLFLCFEPKGQPCHRHVFRAWWEDQTDQTVPELADDYGQLRLLG
jgi:hypothetical protein